VISGGSDVLIKIREGKLAGCTLVSIHDIKELMGVSMLEDGSIKIGPATTFANVTHSDIIEKYIPVLGYAADQAGGPQLRNIGTIGGNVCNGVTSADTASSLMILDAELELTSVKGVRIVPISQWYQGPGRTVREHAELLTAIYIRKASYEGYSANYYKYAQRNAMDIATLGCAVSVKLSEDKKTIADVHLGYGVAAPTPIRCSNAEAELKGKELSAAVAAIGALAVSEVTPRTSWRASKEFRLQLVKELAKRGLARAIQDAGGAE
ncbi:MAG: xanthine dehydrogenase FAD-binding subunit XdhB, partial [Oscillospiraceae bacterium]